MFKNQKGITLIALVITIIVLLILAGVTIAMLTGSDSAPVKANEAKQKQDIGAAKDQVYVAASKLQMDAYENVYVNGKEANGSGNLPVSSATKRTNIGSYVGQNIDDTNKGGIANNTQVGDAKIVFSDAKATYTKSQTGSTVPESGPTQYIKISTTDFEVIGWITAESGVLTWDTIGIVSTN